MPGTKQSPREAVTAEEAEVARLRALGADGAEELRARRVAAFAGELMTKAAGESPTQPDPEVLVRLIDALSPLAEAADGVITRPNSQAYPDIQAPLSGPGGAIDMAVLALREAGCSSVTDRTAAAFIRSYLAMHAMGVISPLGIAGYKARSKGSGMVRTGRQRHYGHRRSH